MKEQAPMMNQHQQQQLMNTSSMVSGMSQQPPPQMMNQHHQQQQPPTQVTENPLQKFSSPPSFPSQMNFNSTSHQKPPQFMTILSGFSTQNSQTFRSHSQIPPQPQQPPQMMNRNYGMWGPPSQPMDVQLKFQNPNRNRNPNPNPNPNHMKNQGGGFFSGGKPLKQPLGPRNNWKGKKVNKPDKRKDLGRRMENPASVGGSNSTGGIGGVVGNIGTGISGGYKPPTLNELQYQNRVKARRFFPKKNFNNKNNYNKGKFAPRNTTSFIIRAKKSGGIAEMVSPCPVTPAVLPTPNFSPSSEVLVDMAKEEWGVDGYGSMKGLIRLRSPGNDMTEGHEDEEEDEGGSSGSDVEEHVEVERRLDHDLSRFEMICPNYGVGSGLEYNNVLENRVDDQDTHIAQLEEENLILKERLFLMERELGDLRRRMQCLERQNHGVADINEEVVENESENDSESHGDAPLMEVNHEEMVEENVKGDGDTKRKEESNVLQCIEANTNELVLADIGGEKKKGTKVQDLKVIEENNDFKVEPVKNYNPGVEESENVTGGTDVRMEEVAHTTKEIISEKPTERAESGNECSEEEHWQR